MRPTTWIGYLDYGDGIVHVVGESGDKYRPFEREMKNLYGKDVEITYREKAELRFPAALADWDNKQR